MPLMAIAVLIQCAFALANFALAARLSRRLRRIAGLERLLLEIRHRLRGNARPQSASAPALRDPAR